MSEKLSSERADLVERLRNLEGNHDLFREAADEIERLREALAEAEVSA